jgi:hypothetical protein
MNMATATAVLATIPASFRGKRQSAGGAEQQLRNLEQQSTCFTTKQLAYGVLYADATGRATGTVSMALRKATPWQAAQLIAAMQAEGLSLISEVASWLNTKALGILA